MLESARLPVRRWWASSPRTRIYHVVLVAVVSFGIWLRLVGHAWDTIGFWWDEAGWAARLLHKPLLAAVIRPLGFMWCTKQLVTLFSPTEFWFRFLPNIASIASLFLSVYVASQLFDSRAARVFLVFAFALHPALIDFAKEFKPYSVEVLIHLVPVVLYLRYRQTSRRRHLYAMLVLLPLLLSFAYTLAFAYPGLLLLSWFRARAERSRALLVAALISGAACTGSLLTIYEVAVHRIKAERSEEYWGKKYDVFYVKSAEQRPHASLVSWEIEKYVDMAAMPGLRRDRWQVPQLLTKWADELRALDRLAWLLLHLLGLHCLIFRRQREELLLLCLPFLVTIGANLLGRWPLGAFRTNLFLCAYLFPLPIYGLTQLAGSGRRRRIAVSALALVLLMVPGFAFGFDGHREKRTWTRSHHMPEVLALLRHERDRELKRQPEAPPAPLIVDGHTGRPYAYYLGIHPKGRALNGKYFRKNFKRLNASVSTKKINERIARTLRSSKRPVWVVISKGQYMQPVKANAPRIGKITFEKRLGHDHLILRIAPRKATRSEKRARRRSKRSRRQPRR